MKVALVIGRFQPVHNQHIEALFKPAAAFDRVIVLLGSSYGAPTFKNPFSHKEREKMIRKACEDSGISTQNFFFYPIKDYPYNDHKWISEVQSCVQNCLASERERPEITIIGSNKDSSSYYLYLFPQWKSLISPVKDFVSATTIRTALFDENLEAIKPLVSKSTCDILYDWFFTTAYTTIKAEWKHKKYVEANSSKNISYCVDNVVYWRGKVLLIRRGKWPGKGLLALPGGHLEADEWPVDGALRELQEETNIKIYTSTDKITATRINLSKHQHANSYEFAHPNRSLIRREITKAFLWVIPDEYEVSVMPGSDAVECFWLTPHYIQQVINHLIFNDHEHIITYMLEH